MSKAANNFAPLTQEMIDLAHAQGKRIALEGIPRKLTTMLHEGKCYALEDCKFRGALQAASVRTSVEPSGQRAKIVR